LSYNVQVSSKFLMILTIIEDKMKAALLGIAHPHSIAHLNTLQLLPEVDGIFLWDEKAEALEAARQSQGGKIEGSYTDLDALLSRDDIFFAIAAVRNDLGPDIFIRVLEAGKHLMAEKPIGRRAADTERVIAAAERTGLQLGVCYHNRHSPVIRQARELVGQGLLGRLMSVEVRLLTTQVQFRNPQHWLFKEALAGGGILSWLGCHYIDMIRYISQDEISSVSAQLATRSEEGIDVEDVAALSLRLESGAVGSFHAGYTLALSGGGYHNPQGYDIYFGLNGQLGRLYWSSKAMASSLYVETVHPAWAAAPQRQFDYVIAESAAYGRVYGETFIRDFILAAQGEGAVPATGQDALQVARVVDAAYESDRTGRRVEVGPGSGDPGRARGETS
jgi:predicted dehydrogenase